MSNSNCLWSLKIPQRAISGKSHFLKNYNQNFGSNKENARGPVIHFPGKGGPGVLFIGAKIFVSYTNQWTKHVSSLDYARIIEVQKGNIALHCDQHLHDKAQNFSRGIGKFPRLAMCRTNKNFCGFPVTSGKKTIPLPLPPSALCNPRYVKNSSACDLRYQLGMTLTPYTDLPLIKKFLY